MSDKTSAIDTGEDSPRVTVTLAERDIDHNDPKAAGFTSGWWWRFEDHLGEVESGAATRDDAREAALTALSSRGYLPEQVDFR